MKCFANMLELNIIWVKEMPKDINWQLVKRAGKYFFVLSLLRHFRSLLIFILTFNEKPVMKLFCCLSFLILCSFSLNAQVSPGVYKSSKDATSFELKLTEDYFVLTTFKSTPAEFLQTIGGFYKEKDGVIMVDLEFNSDFAKDSIRHVDIPYKISDDLLIFDLDKNIVFQKTSPTKQDLDGNWLFATRGPDTGQKRRGEESARKTLKFLMDGRFQWIAYHTETMKFSGTGGGSFTSKDGKYVESIEFFSKDNSRVGADLGFDYEVKGNDWHHTGKNSKGADMYEIWAKR